MRNDFYFNSPPRQTFIFHGKGPGYFIIFLVNVFLIIITLGIYVPWAMVRSRRYVYENMEINGARFGYHAKGGALFLSGFLLILFYTLLFIAMNRFHPMLSQLMVLFLLMLMPFMMVKNLQYNALMTTLNNIRFGFHCSMKKVWWITIGLPMLLLVILGLILFGIASVIFNSYDAIFYKIVFMMIVGMVGISISNGYVYSKWLSLTGKGGSLGIHKFDINVNTRYCIKVCVLSCVVSVPFIVVIACLAEPLLTQMSMSSVMGGMDDETMVAMILQYPGRIFACYILYFTAILLSCAWLWLAFRNHFMNGLAFAQGRIRFRSTLTFPGVVLQLVLLIFVSMVTFGIAFPWMKMRFIRYQANHSHLEGDLDGIALADTEERVDTGFMAVVSRGVMPTAPFI